MNILYYFKYQETPMYQWQKYHIFNELAQKNIKIELFNPLKFSSINEANEQVIKRVKQGGIDLFMTTCTVVDLYINTLESIKQAGIPTLLVCFDNLTVPFNHKRIASHFDLVWLTSIETKYLFDKWGVNSIFLPYAANPNISKPLFDTDEERVLFVGTPYGSRCKMLNTLLDGDVPVTLYAKNMDITNPIIPHNDNGELLKEIYRMLSYPIGRKLAYASLKNKLMGQSKLHKDSLCLTQFAPVPVDQMMRLYNSYALSLSSVSNKHTGVLSKPVLIVNLRSFEIPAAGGVLFCLYNPELDNYFNEGKEAVYYYNDEDMIDKAKFYLSSSRKNVRNQIKRSAYNKAINEHTWFCRFKEVFKVLNLKP